ncbi:MAG: ABC transporter substrate-binding protein [Eubacteriales bacterium]|nr:ABC transporter substrate-binding protein [Eubacteriales bacterium]
MKRRNILSLLLAAAAAGSILTGCSGSAPAQSTAAESTAASSAAETATIEPFTQEEATTDKETAEANPSAPGARQPVDPSVTVRVGSLKGPTSMGLVELMDKSEKGEALCSYEFTMVAAADELLGKMVSKELDIALVPANVASVLYNKTEGGISVIDINTLGVLDIVASDDSIKSMADLKGKTVYATGKGTTPDYVVHYLLQANGLTDEDVKLEFKSEPAEVAALLKEQPDAVAMLPQPFVTAACAQNENLKIVLDLTKEWQAVQGEGGSQLVTGVTVVRNEYLQENKPAVDAFLAEHKDSAAFANEDPDAASELIAAAGIIEKAPVAKKALPYCNIVCITGSDMKEALSGYLQVLFDQDPQSVGGKLPEDGFYYTAE